MTFSVDVLINYITSSRLLDLLGWIEGFIPKIIYVHLEKSIGGLTMFNISGHAFMTF